MYQVNLGDKILYYPASENACIYDTELTEDVGMAGEFSFKVSPDNPLYSELSQGQLVTILRDKKEFWRGEIKEISYDFAKVADVYCVEDLTWLNEEYIAPTSLKTETYTQRFQAAIASYNANRPADRQFLAGYITNVTSTNICNWTTEYEQSILDQLRNCICNASSPQGLIRVRRVTSGGTVTRYIDIVKLADYGVQATQPIEYGYNLLDYVKESDFGNLVNVLTPYGDELDSPIYDEYNARLQGTTITDATSIGIYGRHAKDVVFDGVSDLTNLNNLAQSYLTRYSQPQLTMEVQAVDLAGIENVDAISIGDSVRIIAQPFAVDQWLYLTEIRRDIQNIDKNKITLSGYVQTRRTLTSQTLGTAEAINSMPSKSSILEAAKKNALEILNGADGGYVTFETNASDQITELRIANNLDIDQATKCWVWNINGLGYKSRPTKNDSWVIGVAATMDGSIVADYITSGTMQADRINGGTLTLGGNGNGNGICSVQDADGNEKVSLNNNGITATAGHVGGWTIEATQLTYGGETRLKENEMSCGHYGATVVGMRGRDSSGDNSGFLEVGVNNDMDYIHVHTDYINKKSAGGEVFVEWGTSDKRNKKNIKNLTLKEATDLISQVRPRKFELKMEEGVRYGFIAQELREVLDDNCAIEYDTPTESGEVYHAIHYGDFVAPLCMVVKNMQKEIDALKEELKKIKEGR